VGLVIGYWIDANCFGLWYRLLLVIVEGRGCYELVVMGFIGSGKVDWLVLWGNWLIGGLEGLGYWRGIVG